MRQGMLRALGMMSGTSLDGVDDAIIETDGTRIGAFGRSAYRAYSGNESALLHAALGQWPDGPDVADAAVTGIPDPRWGESPAAFVRLRDAAAVDAEDLLAWANPLLARHQRIAELHVLAGDFPRNTMGKVVKRDLVANHRIAKEDAP